MPPPWGRNPQLDSAVDHRGPGAGLRPNVPTGDTLIVDITKKTFLDAAATVVCVARCSAVIDELLKVSASPDSSENFGRTSVPHLVLGTCQLCVLKIKQIPR